MRKSRGGWPASAYCALHISRTRRIMQDALFFHCRSAVLHFTFSFFALEYFPLHLEEGLLQALRPLLSVVIPAYNEEKRLPQTLERVHGYLSAQVFPSELIVVDDGSSDHTG